MVSEVYWVGPCHPPILLAVRQNRNTSLIDLAVRKGQFLEYNHASGKAMQLCYWQRRLKAEA